MFGVHLNIQVDYFGNGKRRKQQRYYLEYYIFIVHCIKDNKAQRELNNELNVELRGKGFPLF